MKTLGLFGELVELEPEKKKRARIDPSTRNKDGSYKANPCLKLFGTGPEGQRCKHCKHLRSKTRSGKWYKCDLRAGTFGKTSPVSDHRFNWQACKRFEDRG